MAALWRAVSHSAAAPRRMARNAVHARPAAWAVPALRMATMPSANPTTTQANHAAPKGMPVLRAFDVRADAADNLGWQPRTTALPSNVTQAAKAATQRGPSTVELTLEEIAERIPTTSVRELRLLRSRGSTMAVHNVFIAFKVDPPNLSGLVSRDRLILADTGPGARSYVETLRKVLGSNARNASEAGELDGADKPPFFALRVLETVFEESCVSLERSYRRLEVLINRTLPTLTRPHAHAAQFGWLPWVGSANDARREEGFSRLLTLTKSLSDVRSRTQRLVEILKVLLSDADDLAELEYICGPDDAVLIKPSEHPSLLRNPSSRKSIAGPVELTLEAYESRLLNLEDDCDKLEGKIAQTRQTIELSLANESNRIRRLELHIANAALCVGTMACVYGLFGTNVPNGFEEHAGAFAALAGGSIMAGALTSGPFLLSYRSFFGGDLRRADDELALATALKGMEEVQNAVRGDVAFARRLRKALGDATNNGVGADSSLGIESPIQPWVKRLRRTASSAALSGDRNEGGGLPDRLVLETLARTYGSRMRQLRPRELELWREMLEVEYRKMNRLDNDNADDEGTGWLHHGAPPGEGEPQLDKEAERRPPSPPPPADASGSPSLPPESPAVFKRSPSVRRRGDPLPL